MPALVSNIRKNEPLAVRPDRRPSANQGHAEGLLTFIFTAFIVFLIAGSQPFSGKYSGSVSLTGEGNVVRQIGFVVFLILMSPSAFLYYDRLKFILSRNRALLLCYALILLSASWAIAPDISIRRSLGAVVILVVALLGASLPPKQVIWCVLAATALIMTANFFGVFVAPSRSISMDGRWTGMHEQKNFAGFIAAMAFISWFSVGLTTKRRLVILVSFLWLFFLYMTGSKTSMILAIFVTLVLFLTYRLISGNSSRRALYLIATISVFAFGLLFAFAGLFVASPIGLSNYFSEMTFTGRTEIWTFVLYKIRQAPLLGWGYGSFWAVGNLSPAIAEGGKGVRIYSQAHNGFLDTIVANGFLGLSLVMLVVGQKLAPLFDGRFRWNASNGLAPICLGYGLLTFCILHNSMETSFLQGLHPVWTMATIGIFLLSGCWPVGQAEGRAGPRRSPLGGER